MPNVEATKTTCPTCGQERTEPDRYECDGGCGVFGNYDSTSDLPSGWMRIIVKYCGHSTYFIRKFCPSCWPHVDKAMKGERRDWWCSGCHKILTGVPADVSLICEDCWRKHDKSAHCADCMSRGHGETVAAAEWQCVECRNSPMDMLYICRSCHSKHFAGEPCIDCGTRYTPMRRCYECWCKHKGVGEPASADPDRKYPCMRCERLIVDEESIGVMCDRCRTDVACREFIRDESCHTPECATVKWCCGCDCARDELRRDIESENAG